MRKKKTGVRLGKTAEAYIFLTPFLLGAAVFLIYPLYMTIKLSFGLLSGGSNFN